MSILTSTGFIHCYNIDNNNEIITNKLKAVEVYFSETQDIRSSYSILKNYVIGSDQRRADRLYFDNDRETFIICHSLLQLILSKKLSRNPAEISFIKRINNKPSLPGNPIYFNSTRTREAFAIAISKHCDVGIDLENVNRKVDFFSITNTVFSKKEREFISAFPNYSRDIFFLLWTRKEALLKAIGTGIIADLSQIEISEQKNIFKKTIFETKITDPLSNAYFIYSRKILNYQLSIALPEAADIIFTQINGDNINVYLD